MRFKISFLRTTSKISNECIIRFPETKIISKNQEDFNNYNIDHFEKCSNLL